MTEKKGRRKIRRHPDTGEELGKDDQNIFSRRNVHRMIGLSSDGHGELLSTDKLRTQPQDKRITEEDRGALSEGNTFKLKKRRR